MEPPAAASKSPPPTQYAVADAIFYKVAEEHGGGEQSLSMAALFKYLLWNGDKHVEMKPSELHSLFSKLDTDGNGYIDLDEWRVGYTNGLLQMAGEMP